MSFIVVATHGTTSVIANTDLADNMVAFKALTTVVADPAIVAVITPSVPCLFFAQLALGSEMAIQALAAIKFVLGFLAAEGTFTPGVVSTVVRALPLAQHTDATLESGVMLALVSTPSTGSALATHCKRARSVTFSADICALGVIAAVHLFFAFTALVASTPERYPFARITRFHHGVC